MVVPHEPQSAPADPPRDCALCPRLVAYRAANAAAEPDWWNAPAPSFGDPDPRLLVVGLAPGRTGANRTGRPFTGDYAGDVLYPALKTHGFARGPYDPEAYAARGDDGLRLDGALITNAVRCAPPENKPTGAEAAACRPFLSTRLREATSLRVILTLGRIAHDNTLRALGARPAAAPFGHAAEAEVSAPAAWPQDRVTVLASYHTSRYNLNTRRLTPEMFDRVMARARVLAG